MLNHYKQKNTSAFHLKKLCSDKILDTQTEITKQRNQDDQIFNIDPASPVKSTKILYSPA